MKRKQITKHFSYYEMTKTDKGVPNTPDPLSEIHLVYLCRALERIRAKVGCPLDINSGFRTPQVNELVGGSKTSYHLDGRAADIRTINLNDSQKDKLLEAIYDEFPTQTIVHSTYIHFAI